MEETLLSVNQVAILLKVHPLSVRRYIREGKLKAIKMAGNIRIAKSSLEHMGKEVEPGGSGQRVVKAIRVRVFDSDDPIFRLKGRGMSLKAKI